MKMLEMSLAGTLQKLAFERAPRLAVKEVHLFILKHCTEVQRLAEVLLGMDTSEYPSCAPDPQDLPDKGVGMCPVHPMCPVRPVCQVLRLPPRNVL